MDPDFTDAFPLPQDRCYLATAAESLLLASHHQAIQRYFRDKTQGEDGHASMRKTVEHCRTLALQFIGANGGKVGFATSTGQAMTGFMHAIGLQPGDNIILSRLDFISNLISGLTWQSNDVEPRALSNPDGHMPVDTFVEAMDDRTRLVIVSHVSPWSGFRYDLKALHAAVKARGAYLVVDATQSLGVVPVPIEYCDLMVASTYKWLLGIPGTTIVYGQPGLVETLDPKLLGWQGLENWDLNEMTYDTYQDARMFEWGFPNFAGIYVLENALRYLSEVGIDLVQGKTAQLVELAYSQLRQMDFDILTPSDEQQRAGIISLRTSACHEMKAQLRSKGISASASDQRLRIAPYFYNDDADIQRAVDALQTMSKEF